MNVGGSIPRHLDVRKIGKSLMRSGRPSERADAWLRPSTRPHIEPTVIMLGDQESCWTRKISRIIYFIRISCTSCSLSYNLVVSVSKAKQSRVTLTICPQLQLCRVCACPPIEPKSLCDVVSKLSGRTNRDMARPSLDFLAHSLRRACNYCRVYSPRLPRFRLVFSSLFVSVWPTGLIDRKVL